MKVCAACKKAKTLKQFPQRGGRKCKACCNRNSKKRWREKNKTKLSQFYIGGQRKANKELLNQLKNAPCADCKQNFPQCVMDFDHARGKKLRNVSRMIDGPLDQLLAEIEKCDLVCSNCHRVRTFNRRRVGVEGFCTSG